MKIDIFPHIFPSKYFERMLSLTQGGGYMQKRVQGIPVMTDLDLRFRIMDQFPEYVQVLTLGSPPIEIVAGPKESPELARIANDGMAELVEKYPDRFPGFVASLPTNNPEALLQETDRAIRDLGATGVQIFTNVNGRPLDEPDFLPLFEKMGQYDLPIWLHPARPPAFSDYRAESKSKYELWWVFGWPYETSIAMGRIVFTGIFDRYPNLKIITHHMGAMTPYFEGRIGGGLDQLGRRTDDEDLSPVLQRLKKRPIDYFHMFYGDSALFGAIPATECGLAFFGADRVLFGTDMPFDPEMGPGYIRDTIHVIDHMRASAEERQKIYEGNARKILKLRLKG